MRWNTPEMRAFPLIRMPCLISGYVGKCTQDTSFNRYIF